MVAQDTEPRCGNCGYRLAGLEGPTRCPECGMAVSYARHRRASRRANRLDLSRIVYLMLLCVALFGWTMTLGGHRTTHGGAPELVARRQIGTIAVIACAALALGGLALACLAGRTGRARTFLTGAILFATLAFFWVVSAPL
jgi:hypothetical protein